MNQPFGLTNDKGEIIRVVEAAERIDATLYGFRHVPGFSGNVVDPIEHAQAQRACMLERFQGLGYSEDSARVMVEGRAFFDRERLERNLASFGMAADEARTAAEDEFIRKSFGPVVKVARQEPNPDYLPAALKERKPGRATKAEGSTLVELAEPASAVTGRMLPNQLRNWRKP